MKHDEKITARIAEESGIPLRQVIAAVELLNAGNTIPFIARYRKEATHSLNEIALRAIEDTLEKLNVLAARKNTILKTIQEQGVLTDELKRQIDDCTSLRDLEIIYLPFKPKRRTRATIARERGLQPLADLLFKQETLSQARQKILQPYVNPRLKVPDTATALAGAMDIVAEHWAENPETRAWLADKAMKFGKVASKVKRGKKTAEGADKFEQYFEREESVSRIPSHRLMAMLRGSSEGILRVGLQLDESRELSELKRQLVHNRQFEFHRDLLDGAEDCFTRLLLPATESTVLQQLKEQADEDAISVFGKNLHELLMAAPAGPRVTIGIDPGFRTGCKVAVVDGTGQFLANATIYPTPPQERHESSRRCVTEVDQSTRGRINCNRQWHRFS